MFSRTKQKVNQLLNAYNLDDKVQVQVTNSNEYILDLNEVLTVAFENNLGKIYNEKYYEKMIDKDSLFLRLCGSFILNELRNDKELTTQIYLDYLKEKNISLFVDDDIEYLAYLELFYVILSKLYEMNKLFKLPLSAIHMSFSHQEHYAHQAKNLKDLSVLYIESPNQFKKQWIFHRIEDVVNKNLELLDIYSLSTFLSNEGMRDGDAFSLYKAPFNSFSTNLSFVENIDLFLNEHKTLKDLLPEQIKDTLMSNISVISGLEISNIRKEKILIDKTGNKEPIYRYLDFEFYDAVGLIVFFERKLFNHISYSAYKIDNFK